MSGRNKKGTTLIELLISTAILSIVMLSVYSMWQASTASAQHCMEMSENTDSPFILLNNMKSQFECLNTTDKEMPVRLSYSGTKLTLSLFTNKKINEDHEHPWGPFIVKYIYDKQTGKLWYYQKSDLDFSDKPVSITDSELIDTGITDFNIEYRNNNSWKRFDNEMIDKNKADLIRITLTKKTKDKESQYSITVCPV